MHRMLNPYRDIYKQMGHQFIDIYLKHCASAIQFTFIIQEIWPSVQWYIQKLFWVDFSLTQLAAPNCDQFMQPTSNSNRT